MSLEEIKNISLNKFINILDKSINRKAYEYLMMKRGSKGEEIIYNDMKMAEYLMPNSENLTISEKQYIFSMRN